MREHHNAQTLRSYLDTPAGRLRVALHSGNRAAAAAELAQDEEADRAFRQREAERLFEKFPGRFPSVADARGQVADPQGSSGIWFSGSSDDLARLSRRADVAAPIRSLGEPQQTGQDTLVLGPDGPADTRAPWQRG